MRNNPMLNKPIWSEGLFIKPTHFQQQERYFEHSQRQLLTMQSSYAWGFTELELDQDKLAMGKIGLIAAKGIFPDGTLFSLPNNCDMPTPYEPDDTISNEIIYLCLPSEGSGQEMSLSGNTHNQQTEYESKSHQLRYSTEQICVNNIATHTLQSDTMAVAKPNLKLLRERDNREGYSCLGITLIKEKDSNDAIKISKRYIPPFMNISGHAGLYRYLNNIAELLTNQIRILSSRISASGTGGVAEVEDMLKLQIFNRYRPLFVHLIGLPLVHPLRFYEYLIQLVGELTSFGKDHNIPELAAYQHTDSYQSFDNNIMLLKELISREIDPKAINIPVKEPRYGIYRALINDKALLENSHFVLAVKADAPNEELRQLLPQQTRISAIETIRDLIQQNTLGLPISPLSTVPRQLPFHQGFVYFNIDKKSNHWKTLENSTGFAFQFSGNYTGLALEFWAIKE